MNDISEILSSAVLHLHELVQRKDADTEDALISLSDALANVKTRRKSRWSSVIADLKPPVDWQTFYSEIFEDASTIQSRWRQILLAHAQSVGVSTQFLLCGADTTLGRNQA